jgi:hypothetical protein
MKRERHFLMPLLLALCGHAFAQGLPDAPSAIRGIRFELVEPAPVRSQSIVADSNFHEPRGRKKLLVLAGAVAFEAVANRYDVSETEKGIKAEVALEDYTWLVGSKPTSGQLYVRDLLTVGILVTPSIVAYAFRMMEPFYMAACLYRWSWGASIFQGAIRGRLYSRCARQLEGVRTVGKKTQGAQVLLPRLQAPGLTGPWLMHL